MKRSLFFVLAISLVISGAALASGSSRASSTSGSSGAVAAPGVNPMLVTETLTCIVTAIHADGAVEVKDNKSGKVSKLRIRPTIKITAQDKKAFDGRKVLEAADLQVGHVLKITHRPAAREIVRIKVLKGRVAV